MVETIVTSQKRTAANFGVFTSRITASAGSWSMDPNSLI